MNDNTTTIERPVMKFFALSLSGLSKGKLEHWWGEAEDLRAAIVLAEADHAGLKVTYGSSVTEAQYNNRDRYA